jgi:hypothetical protein
MGTHNFLGVLDRRPDPYEALKKTEDFKSGHNDERPLAISSGDYFSFVISTGR